MVFFQEIKQRTHISIIGMQFTLTIVMVQVTKVTKLILFKLMDKIYGLEEKKTQNQLLKLYGINMV